MSSEKIIYSGRPSQVVNLKLFFICGVIFAASMFYGTVWDSLLANKIPQFHKQYIIAMKALFFIAPLYALSAWLKVYCHKYQISTERLHEEIGVLSKVTSEVELYRVKDITFAQPFSLRMFGCGNIILDTSDKSTPIVVLHAIKNARPVIDLIRKNVDIMRTKKGVREID